MKITLYHARGVSDYEVSYYEIDYYGNIALYDLDGAWMATYPAGRWDAVERVEEIDDEDEVRS